jgi:putative hydrolase of the HAD superfamily
MYDCNLDEDMREGRSQGNGRVPIRGIVFDYGNVLCHPQEHSDVERMSQVCGIDTPRFQELYWKFRMPYDRGDLDGKAYWDSVAREQDIVLPPRQIAQLIALDTKSWSRRNEETLAWVKQLHHARFQLALLSNMPLEVSRSLSAQDDWAPLFEHLTFSCDVHRVKPDPAIYLSCLGKMKLPAEQVLFLDDIAANVEGAAALGIHALIFDTAQGTSARVAERFDLPVPDFGS